MSHTQQGTMLNCLIHKPLSSFFVSLIPLVYFFIQHKVHRVPGGVLIPLLKFLNPFHNHHYVFAAYTRYAFFEWGLVFFDVLYDSVAEQEFRESGLQVRFLISLPFSQPTLLIYRPTSILLDIPFCSRNTDHVCVFTLSETFGRLLTLCRPKPDTKAFANTPSAAPVDSTIPTPTVEHAAPDKALADALDAALSPAPDRQQQEGKEQEQDKREQSTPSPSRARAALSVLSDIYLGTSHSICEALLIYISSDFIHICLPASCSLYILDALHRAHPNSILFLRMGARHRRARARALVPPGPCTAGHARDIAAHIHIRL